jgi:hypothetical protein
LVLAALVVLLKQYRATAIAQLMAGLAVLALGALPVVGLEGLAVKQQHKAVDQ